MFSPDVVLFGWLGSKLQLLSLVTCGTSLECWYFPLLVDSALVLWGPFCFRSFSASLSVCLFVSLLVYLHACLFSLQFVCVFASLAHLSICVLPSGHRSGGCMAGKKRRIKAGDRGVQKLVLLERICSCKGPNPLSDSIIWLGLIWWVVWWPVLLHVQMASDGSASVGDSCGWWAHHNRLADSNTDEKNAELVALFLGLGWIERSTDK